MRTSTADELFRYVLLRAPRAIADESVIAILSDSPFAREIDQAGSVSEWRRLADLFVASDQLLTSIRELGLASAIQSALASPMPTNSVARFSEWLQAHFGQSPQKIIADKRFLPDLQRVLDSLLAIKLARGRFPQNVVLLRTLRLLHGIREVAAERVTDAQLRAVLSALVLYPKIEQKPPSSISPPPGPVTHVPGTAAPAKPAHKNPVTLRLALQEVQGAITQRKFTEIPEPVIKPFKSEPIFGLFGFFGSSSRSAEDSIELEQSKSKAVAFSLNEAARNSLSASTRAILGQLGFDAEVRPAWHIANLLQQAIVNAAEPVLRNAIYFVNGQPVFIPGPSFWPGLFNKPPVPTPIPTSTGLVQPAGIGDLHVVRQQIVRYEPSEVARIENIARGSNRTDEHRRLDISESVSFSETERMEQSERELSTTERFELKQESERTIREDAALKAGVTVSGSYGPSVSFSASVEASFERSTEESNRRSVEYGKDVVDRSVSKLSERVLNRKEQLFRREIEQKSRDERDNKAGDAHVRGIFQWVDKIYEAQVYDYGKRLMFDVVVPEPAALLRHALVRDEQVSIPPPIPPLTITAAEIQEDTYMGFCAQYGASDVQPPPEPYVTISATFAQVLDGGVDGKRIATEKKLEIPKGYFAAHCYVDMGISRGGNWWFDVWVGQVKYQNKHNQSHLSRGGRAMSGERGEIPLGLHGGGVNAFTVIIEVLCEATPMAVDQWRLETYEKIREAYELRLREREEALAMSENANAGVVDIGRNPATNRQTERIELKRACISMLSGQRFELFDATRTLSGDGTQYPEIDFSEAAAEGEYVRFFEQAFEWEQMTYLLYPYFWSRKSDWLDRLLDRDSDPQFAQFISAGAARTQLPVRPGFEAAVLHFLETGRVWNGSDDPPPIGSPLYLSLVDEIRARTDAGNDGIPVGAPWKVRVPTEITWLRNTPSFPEWRKQDDGAWLADSDE